MKWVSILLMLSFIGEFNSVDCRIIQLSTLGVSDTAVVSVEPDTIWAQEVGIGVGDTFTDSIYIRDVSIDSPMTQYIIGVGAGGDSDMTFNPQVLHCIHIREGPFLKQFGSTVFIATGPDNDNGTIKEITCILTGWVVASGSGTLCYLKWQVMDTGSSQIDLGVVLLLNGLVPVPPVPCSSTNGYFYLPGHPGTVSESHTPNRADYLLQAYPNPFGQKVVISYQLPSKTKISLKVYNIAGDLVTVLIDNEENGPGYYSFDWDAEKVVPGIYFLRLESNPDCRQTGDVVVSRKVLKVK